MTPYPLSSVIVGETISHMIEAAMNVNLIKGFRLSRSVPLVSHLQFADDILVFLIL